MFDIIHLWNIIRCLRDIFESLFSSETWLKSFKSTCLALCIHPLSFYFRPTVCSWHDDRPLLWYSYCLDNSRCVFCSTGQRSLPGLRFKVTAALLCCCRLAARRWSCVVGTCKLTPWHYIQVVISLESHCINHSINAGIFLFLFVHVVKSPANPACVHHSFKVALPLCAGRQSNLLRDVARVQCGYRCGHWLACRRTEGSQVTCRNLFSFEGHPTW